MTFDPTAWMIGGGAEHGPELGRLLAYASTSGSEGIVTPGDLKVVPYDVAGDGVRILAGAGLILNRYPGGSQQTYVVRNPTETRVEQIPATTSMGPRADLIVVRLHDPQYPGTAVPSDPRTFQYVRAERIPNVPADAGHEYVRTLNYPAMALARINLPTSTSTITAAMITDLRRLALPREHRVLLVDAVTNSDMTGTSYGAWGNWQPEVEVPPWATYLTMRADIGGAVSMNGAVTGYIRTIFGNIAGEGRGFDIDSTGAERFDFVVLFGAPIPAAMRGTRQRLQIQGYRTLAGGETGFLRTLNPTTHFGFDLQFEERAV
jgi:hypothetical protein